jgi:predicted CoA-binding protein
VLAKTIKPKQNQNQNESESIMKVYVLKEEVDVVAVFATREAALKCAEENELRNFYIQELTVRG